MNAGQEGYVDMHGEINYGQVMEGYVNQVLIQFEEYFMGSTIAGQSFLRLCQILDGHYPQDPHIPDMQNMAALDIQNAAHPQSLFLAGVRIKRIILRRLPGDLLDQIEGARNNLQHLRHVFTAQQMIYDPTNPYLLALHNHASDAIIALNFMLAELNRGFIITNATPALANINLVQGMVQGRPNLGRRLENIDLLGIPAADHLEGP